MRSPYPRHLRDRISFLPSLHLSRLPYRVPRTSYFVFRLNLGHWESDLLRTPPAYRFLCPLVAPSPCVLPVSASPVPGASVCARKGRGRRHWTGRQTEFRGGSLLPGNPRLAPNTYTILGDGLSSDSVSRPGTQRSANRLDSPVRDLAFFPSGFGGSAIHFGLSGLEARPRWDTQQLAVLRGSVFPVVVSSSVALGTETRVVGPSRYRAHGVLAAFANPAPPLLFPHRPLAAFESCRECASSTSTSTS